MHSLPRLLSGILLLALFGGPRDASGQRVAYEVDRAASTFAVVTHKAGIAAALAHNHLVEPVLYEATLHLDPADPPNATFSLAFDVVDLRVDDPARQERLLPRLTTLGVVEEFGDISESDRSDVRETMLSDDQLDAERHPRIAVRSLAVSPSEGASIAGEEFPWMVAIEMEVHGRAVEILAPARVESSEEGVRIEAVAESTFSTFGIEPFSSFLGAVKNQDRIHLYLDLVATPALPGSPRENRTETPNG